MENIKELNNINNEIRLNFNNEQFFLIEWPKDYKNLLFQIKKNIENFTDDKIKCYYIKINDSDLKINKKNFFVNDKEKQDIIEIFVCSKIKEKFKENYNADENKLLEKNEILIQPFNNDDIKILKGTKEYVFYFKLCNIGRNTLPVITICKPDLNKYNKKLGYEFKKEEVLFPENLEITDMLEPNEIKNYCKLIFKNISNNSKYMIMRIKSNKIGFNTIYVEPFFVKMVDALD